MTTMNREVMSLSDTVWLRLEDPRDPVDIVALVLLDAVPETSSIERLVVTRLLDRYPRFRQRAVEPSGGIGRPRWETDPGFTLERHVRRVLSEGRSLPALIEDVTNRPWDFDHPPWQLEVVHGLDAGGAIIARLHHCIADGFALGRVMLSLCDGNFSSEPPPAKTSAPVGLRGAVREARRAAAAAAHLLFLPFDRASPLRGELSGRRHVAWSRAIPIERIKRIGAPFGATVNDLLLGAMTGALRRFLLLRGDPADDVRAIVPINLRPAHWIEEMEPVLGNRFGLVYLDLPTRARDPRERLELLEKRMQAIKASADPMVSWGVLTGIGALPSRLEHVATDIFGRKASVVATNVPGPRRRLSLAGCGVTDLVFWVPHPAHLGIGISIISYAGTVRVGVRADVALVADPTTITGAFEDELDALEQAANASAEGARGAGSARESCAG